MADFVYETLPKKDIVLCIFIVYLLLSPHELNDSKWFQMDSNDFSWFFRHIETHLESFQIIWSHLSHEVTKLAIL